LLAIPRSLDDLQFLQKVAARGTSQLYVPAVRKWDLGTLTVSFTDNHVPSKSGCLQGYVNSGYLNKSRLPTGIEFRAFCGLCIESTLKCALTMSEDTGIYGV